MTLNNFNNFYFIGIGGIGMSALARYFKSLGKNVAGYDRTSTLLTDELITEGINIHFEENVNLIPKIYLIEDTLIVYTPAIPQSHEELSYFRNNKFLVKKRSEVLGLITENSFTIAVAGTHGKTTTSSIITHILKSANLNCTAFLGGITKNYNTNLILSHNKNTSDKSYTVVEADEYDRSFLMLQPNIGIITSMDADHLDIYGSKEQMETSYKAFADKISDKLIIKAGLDIKKEHVSYSIDKAAEYHTKNIKVINHQYIFDVQSPTSYMSDLTLGLPGIHNVENALAAVAVAQELDIKEEIIRPALLSYKGVKRRFDYQIQTESLVFLDDYAHHPEELKACIKSVRELYPTKKITGIFQPHLYTRTRDFAEEFAESLSILDELIMLDIYPARELPIEGVTSKMILDKVRCKNKKLLSKNQLLEELHKQKIEVLLTLGAGDIDQLVELIKEILIKKITNKQLV